MPVTAAMVTGDIAANQSPFVDLDITLPDSGVAVVVAGQVKPQGGWMQPLAGSVNSPGVPGSGSNYFLIEANPNSVLAGTVAITNGSTAVTGTGTAFNTALVAGQFVVFASDPTHTPYQVASITSATALVLSVAYAGATVASTTASTGTVTAKTSTTAMPTVDAGQIAVFQQVIPSTAPAAISAQGGWTVPVQW